MELVRHQLRKEEFEFQDALNEVNEHLEFSGEDQIKMNEFIFKEEETNNNTTLTKE
jgi:hypothetical protein